ncbi:MAG: response regulator [Anaerolineae bacterium]
MSNKVLIVDDEEAFQLLMATSLQRSGYQPLTASNAIQAIAIIRQSRPDAIILDDMMPGMSGADFCATLKKDPALRNIPVILYTSGVRYALDELRERSGADAALRKTGKMQDLLAVLKQLLIAAV